MRFFEPDARTVVAIVAGWSALAAAVIWAITPPLVAAVFAPALGVVVLVSLTGSAVRGTVVAFAASILIAVVELVFVFQPFTFGIGPGQLVGDPRLTRAEVWVPIVLALALLQGTVAVAAMTSGALETRLQARGREPEATGPVPTSDDLRQAALAVQRATRFARRAAVARLGVDTNGSAQEASEELASRLGPVVRGALRRLDTVARSPQGEYLVVLAGVRDAGARRVVERLRSLSERELGHGLRSSLVVLPKDAGAIPTVFPELAAMVREEEPMERRSSERKRSREPDQEASAGD